MKPGKRQRCEGHTRIFTRKGGWDAFGNHCNCHMWFSAAKALAYDLDHFPIQQLIQVGDRATKLQTFSFWNWKKRMTDWEEHTCWLSYWTSLSLFRNLLHLLSLSLTSQPFYQPLLAVLSNKNLGYDLSGENPLIFFALTISTVISGHSGEFTQQVPSVTFYF